MGYSAKLVSLASRRERLMLLRIALFGGTLAFLVAILGPAFLWDPLVAALKLAFGG